MNSKTLALCLPFLVGACGSDEAGKIDETGYLNPASIYYTSTDALSSAEVEVTIVGVPGALENTTGALVAINTRTEQAFTPITIASDGSFLILALAAADDGLGLEYRTDDGLATEFIVLTDTLDSLATPNPIEGSTGPAEITVLGSSGSVSVDLNVLVAASPPYIVYNETNGASVFATTTDQPIIISGAAGHRICVFQVGAEGNQSAAYCETVEAI
jgi:hypothetical protein